MRILLAILLVGLLCGCMEEEAKATTTTTSSTSTTSTTSTTTTSSTTSSTTTSTTATLPERDLVRGDFDEPMILPVGKVAFIEEDDLKVRLLSVAADSRCPKDSYAACIWAGTVIIRVDASKGEQGYGEYQVDGMKATEFGEYRISILNATPVKTSKHIDQSEYNITVILNRID